jgi:hypothetical protein
MNFPDAAIPITTCDGPDCADCSISRSIHCHFGPSDLLHFYLISLPTFIVGGAGILAVGLIPLLVWIGLIVGYFNFIEIRVMCSHCPHYAEEGKTLRCWANYGSPKIWKYRPGPMSTVEKVVFIAGLVVVFGYPLVFFIAGASWYLMGLYVLLAAGFYVSLKRSFCCQCMNMACPLNSIPAQVREEFFKCNPVVGRAWGHEPVRHERES